MISFNKHIIIIYILTAVLFALWNIKYWIINKYFRRKTIIAHLAFSFCIFLIVIILSEIFCDFEWYYITDGILFAAILSLIEVIKQAEPDFNFLLDSQNSEQVLLFKLNMLYDKWMKIVTWLTVLLISGMLVIALKWIDQIPDDIRLGVTLSIMFKLSFLAIGIILGIYMPIMTRVNLIEEKVLAIKKFDE